MVAMLVLVHGHSKRRQRRPERPAPKCGRLALFDAEGKRAVTLRGATIRSDRSEHQCEVKRLAEVRGVHQEEAIMLE